VICSVILIIIGITFVALKNDSVKKEVPTDEELEEQMEIEMVKKGAQN
jgi:uncharacterized membrane-anchored protein YhcB (DUF1043 family)